MTALEASGLRYEELTQQAARFGVADEQVRKDHLISHILASLSSDCAQDFVFFGGTALSRTHLVDARLSEDIDLLAVGNRGEAAQRLVKVLDRSLRATHGKPVWRPQFTDRDAEAGVLTASGIAVKVQILRGTHYPAWPVESRDLEQRYSDAMPARLTVPTLPAFAAWKTVAWVDRREPRDLYDLWALHAIGALTSEAAHLYARFGNTGRVPEGALFARPPTETQWHASLGGQTRLRITAGEALDAVRLGWAEVHNKEGR